MNKWTSIGMAIAFILTLLGVSAFVLFFSVEPFFDSLSVLYAKKKLGAILSIGALLNIPVFYYLIRIKKNKIAFGMIAFLFFLTGIIAFLKVN